MRTSKILKDIAICSLIFFGVFYVLPKTLSLTLKSPYPIAAVSSNSMQPILEKGDLILIKGVKKGDIKTGDIVVYKIDEGFIIHRVIKLQDRVLITKGDANTYPDLPVKYDKVVGETVNIGKSPLTIPYLGNITAFANPVKK